MNTTGTMKAAEYAAQRRQDAARTGRPIQRMSETLPSLHVREKLFVWVDKGRVRTSDGPMKGHEIAAVLLNTDNESESRREIVMPTHRDLRLLIRAFSRARFTTIDQRNVVLAARRVLDVALVTPWFSSLTIITRALTARYWAPFEDTDDLTAWARCLGVADPHSSSGLGDLYRLSIRGSSTRQPLHPHHRRLRPDHPRPDLPRGAQRRPGIRRDGGPRRPVEDPVRRGRDPAALQPRLPPHNRSDP